MNQLEKMKVTDFETLLTKVLEDNRNRFGNVVLNPVQQKRLVKNYREIFNLQTK